MRRFPWAETIVALLALGVLGLLAYFNARSQENAVSQVDTRSTYDYASGGYRAWYETLAAEGVRVERFEQRPAFLDDAVDVYVTAVNLSGTLARSSVGGSVTFFEAGDWDALAKWTKAGGHLVWLADSAGCGAARSFSGISGCGEPEDMKMPGDIRSVGPSPDMAVAISPSPLTAGVDGVSGTSKLRMPFTDGEGAAPLVADDTGSVVSAYRFGKGVVVIVTDETLFQNSRFGMADNARLAYDLATAGLSPHGTVAFDEWSHGYVTGDTWWKILPRPFQVAIIVLGIVFGALIVGSALRFGPVMPPPDDSERTSAEYVASMARLYERGGAVKAAIAEICDGCIRDVAAAAGLPENAPVWTIAARAGGGDQESAPAKAVLELHRLRGMQYPHPSDLMSAARSSASLRKEFIRHGRTGIGRRSPFKRRAA